MMILTTAGISAAAENTVSQAQAVSLKTADGTALTAGSVYTSEISVTDNGMYEFALSYTSDSAQDIVLKLSVDEKYPFDGAERLRFPCYWVNENDDWASESGDQYTPEQVIYGGTVESFAKDYSGESEFPYSFELAAGKHTVSLSVIQGSLALNGFSLIPAQSAEKYTRPEEKDLYSDCDPIIIEGENATVKNSRYLIPLSDAASILVHPSDVKNRKLNYIGGSNWSQPGQEIVWSFNAPADGYYCIGFEYRQSQAIGSATFRSMKIDGRAPFSESGRVRFNYTDTWDYMTYSDAEGVPYYIYLTKGAHTLSLESTVGALAQSYSSLKNVTAMMGDLYVEITKVVGESVDMYRSYELFNQVPDFNKRLSEITEKLAVVTQDMMALQNDSISSNVSVINDAVNVVKRMIDNPYTAHRYISEFYDAYSNLSAVMTDMTATPLDIDRIVLSGVKAPYGKEKISFVRRLKHSVERFAITFVGDYNTLSSDAAEGEALTIWINWGRDQAEAFNNILQDDFVKKSGIPVNVSVVNATLIQAIISGKGPDCLIQMARTEPVNLAMRGALRDLTEFSDYEEIAERFNENAELPYKYNGGVYALPLTQEFFVTFMRTDILGRLGIETPQTWQDFINAATVLQRNNLQAVIPYTALSDSGAVNTGVGGLNLFSTFLIQNGLSLYNEKGDACALSETPQIQTFVGWTDLYTKYKFQEITNFFNRFRLGSAPLGISTYTLYTQLKAAAPEIDGRWEIAMLPGTVGEDGSVDHSSAGWGTACSITKLSKQPEKAWKFLKWWTSAETQLKYSNMLESVLGPLGRVATANKDAFARMDWDAKMYSVLAEQSRQTVEIPEVPGGYYTARGIDQAFWNVTEAGKNPTEMIKKWSGVINTEISRKLNEYKQ